MNKLNSITFQTQGNGSGRVASGTDYLSGLLFYNASLYSTFGTAIKNASNTVVGGFAQLFSAQDAVGLGIDGTYADETKATGAQITLTGVGAVGDTISVYIQEWKNKVLLGTYTRAAGDTTVTLLAASITSMINANASTNGTVGAGYTATSSVGVISLIARAGTGIYLNSGTPVSIAIVGTVTGSVTSQFSGGVASLKAVYYYHIQRYFIMKPDGSLFVGIFNTGDTTYADIALLQTAAKGTIVQLGIWDNAVTYALSTLTKIQTVVNSLKTNNKLLSSVVYAGNLKGVVTLANLASTAYDLGTLTASNVSALVDQDGNGTGWDLFNGTGVSISSLGAAIGCISQSAISEDFGNPIPEFNCDDGTEFDTLAFGEGTLFSAVDVAGNSTLDSMNNNRYLYLSKIAYTAGSYYSDDHTAITVASDFAYVHDNRIIDRVIKNEFTALTPLLKSKLKLNTDGTMTVQTIANIVQLAGEPIKALVASEDLAGDPNNFDASKWVIVNPLQKPNTTGNLTIQIKLVENGIAHSVIIPIGYVTSL